MDALYAPFSAGSLHWIRYGPCHHVPHQYEQVKFSVLLGNTTRRWRASAFAPWQRVPAGSLSLCVSGQGPETEFAGDGQFLAFDLASDFLAKSLPRFPDASRTDLDLYGVRDPFLFHLAAEATAILRREGTLSKAYAESMALLIGVHVRQRYLEPRLHAKPPRPAPMLSPAATRRVLDHIDARLDQPLPLGELAEVAGLSSFHFARAFRATVGETPHRLVMRRRAESARALLLSAQDRVTPADAAFRAGFSSQSHLTRCLREMFGQTPGELLRKEKSNRARA